MSTASTIAEPHIQLQLQLQPRETAAREQLKHLARGFAFGPSLALSNCELLTFYY